MGCLIVFILFLLAYIEISIFIAISSHLGVMLTLILLLLTSAIGLVILRQEGLKQLSTVRNTIFNPQPTPSSIVKNIALFFAAILFIIPGFFSDFLALLLLLPPVQNLLMTRWLPYLQVKMYRTHSYQSGRTFEGEYKEHHHKQHQDSDDNNSHPRL